MILSDRNRIGFRRTTTRVRCGSRVPSAPPDQHRPVSALQSNGERLRFVTVDDLVERGLGTLETLHKLEQVEGHLLNWYDTGTLAPLYPRYVSTVDSGNLLASLWALGQGYRDVLERPLIGPRALTGVADTLGVLRQSLQSEWKTGATPARTDDLVATLESLCADPPPHLFGRHPTAPAASGPARDLAEAIQVAAARRPQPSQAPERVVPAAPASDGTESQSVYWSHQLSTADPLLLEVCRPYLPWVKSLASQSDEVALARVTMRLRGDGESRRWRPRCARWRLARGHR